MSDITVIGAGVIGLSTGIRLVERGHRVRIATAAMPLATTSSAATAMVGLAFAEPFDRVRAWEEATTREMSTILIDPDAGIRRQRCLLASRTTDARPPGIESWPGFRPANVEELPGGFAHGFWIDMIVADMSRYLPYLVGRFESGGGAIEVTTIESLTAITESIVVNCSGMGARSLAQDDTLTGRWGMHVVIAGSGEEHGFMEGPPGPDRWVGWMPHGDRVLVGGVIVPEADDPDPHEIGTQLLDAAVAVNPRLADARLLGHNAGIRPTRDVVRVERDPEPGSRVVHNYGHGSLGVTLSWGCADEVVDLVEALA